MKRVIGAWFLFVLVALPNVGELDLSHERLAAVAPPPPSARPTPERPAAPPLFRTDPLRFLSTAPADSLRLLPGIGPVIAARIIAARGGKVLFKQWDDLLAIRGIGPKKLSRLKQLAADGR